ncbi:PD-(D/E)XK nuclease family protein [Campylobacter mucosalis]|uniref:Exonuclease V, helicase AddB n=1 Tax=Campylobacter mucosalis CCUG 21559 TaxID=1032067 RepID=A0A6G5QFV9_9BACT|nr:PD-(D/E)XK nuclease family protein [Campylobacter mucosalis]QCD44560.1 exonuclease V, helicase AddB [Campylobacter mucosalis CCUG 21559]
MLLNDLNVFTSLRAIREFNSSFSNALVPKSMSIGEFFSKAIMVNGLNEASDSELLIYMNEACSRCYRANSVLNIPNEFFAFLKNNDYLFSFFKEVYHQKKSFDDLKFSDIYANYEEHIEILSEVAQNYKEILLQNGLYDAIILPEVYSLNESYISSFDSINIHIDGLLSEFEWEVILALKTPVKIYFKTSNLNTKLIKKIAEISNKSIDDFAMYFEYELSLGSGELRAIRACAKNRVVTTKSFSLQSLQSAFVFEKISTFIKDGIDAKRIVVILPDESFSQILSLHDSSKMLSFAMGKSVKNTKFYTLVFKICECLKEGNEPILSTDYFKLDNKILDKNDSFLNFVKLPNELFLKIKTHFNLIVNFDIFSEILCEIFDVCGENRLSEIFKEELFFLKNLIEQKRLSLSQALEFFLLRFKDRSIDDVGGGAVKVMGLLESRGLCFDGVIIVDFNDEFVPKRSVNEMFLSSKVRQKAGLISYADRENLQRFYYESLIGSAKKVAISYVLDESRISSRFLNAFTCVEDSEYDEQEYLRLFSGGKLAVFNQTSPLLEHNFFAKPLSFSRLNTFLTCPRKYYYKYVCGFSEPRSLGVGGSNFIGNAYHDALFEYYNTHKEFDLSKFLAILSTKGLNKLDLEIARQKFKTFAQSENAHFDDGWRVKELEAGFKNIFEGVEIEGKIDRIDCRGDELCIIDYKSGSLPKDTLQLSFYQALLGVKAECYFYDLKDEMKLVFAQTDTQILKEYFTSIKEYFKKPVSFEPEISSNCHYCAYFTICRGLK